MEVEHLQLAHQAEGGRLDLGYLIVGQVQDLERLEPDEGVGGEEVAGDGVPGEVEEDEAAEALEDARREEGEAVVAQGELAQRRRRVEEGRRQGRQLRDDQRSDCMLAQI